MDLGMVLSAAAGVIAGLVVALKVIAPRTKTKADDALLVRLEQLEKLLPKT